MQNSVSSGELIHDVCNIAAEVGLVVLLVEALQHVLEELLESVVCVFSSIDHVVEKVLSKLVLAFAGVAFVEHTNQFILSALFVHLELNCRRCQEVVEDDKCLRD